MIKLKNLLNEAKDTVKDFDFNKDELEFIAALVNNVGSGQHPMADTKNVGGFKVKYIKDLLQKVKSKVPPKYKAMVNGVNDKLTKQ